MKAKELINKELESEKTSNGDKKPYYIVYLDDEVDLLEPVSDIVKEFNLTPFCSTSEETALDFINKNQNKVLYIISDYKLNGFTGFDFRKKVFEKFPEIPFAILSANITKELALQGIELKISAFHDKPISTEKFSELIEKDGIQRLKLIKEDQELLDGFIQEAKEKLEQAEELVLLLESNPNDLETINKFFGIVHTLKGASGYFKPKTLHQFVHRFEDLLKKLQNQEIQITSEIISTILKSFDFIKTLLEEFFTGNHKSYDLTEIIQNFFEFKSTSPEKSEKNPTKENLETQKTSNVQNDVKVPVKLLDHFLQTSGEMTVIRNMINKCVKSIEKQYPGNKDVSMLNELLEELHTINSATQTQISNIRKLPIQHIIKPIPRVIRDVCKTLNKQAELKVIGDELAVDTSIASVLNNCIIHLIRNSLDHGLETPEKRKLSNKPEKGILTINCSQKNDVIYISIEDDGAGINEQSIKNKLVKNGTHTEQQAHALDKKELYSMIFESGFSTAEKVTDISGRGVGMSMVKDSVQSVGGFIDIESITGKGSKFTLVMPVPKSVLIQDCLFIVVNNHTFGIPQDDIIKVLQLSSISGPQIQSCEGTDTILFEDELIPIVNMNEVLRLHADSTPSREIKNYKNLIIIGSKNRKLAISVDDIHDIEDTVIKPLQGIIKKLEIFQGAAYLGDGSIGLIFSTEGILNKVGIKHKKHTKQNDKEIKPKTENDESIKFNGKSELLLFSIGDQSIYGLPTSYIYRIEDIATKDIESTNGFPVIAYRNQVLNIINLNSILNNDYKITETRLDNRIKTLVLKFNQQFLGLLIDNIIDIVNCDKEPTPLLEKQLAINGTAIINNYTVTIINPLELINIIKNGNTQTLDRHKLVAA